MIHESVSHPGGGGGRSEAKPEEAKRGRTECKGEGKLSAFSRTSGRRAKQILRSARSLANELGS